MVPVVAEVSVTATLPERARPVAAGVETPGQDLFADGEVLSARFSVSGMRLTTVGQDLVYRTVELDNGGLEAEVVEGADRDIDVIRARATMAYTHIGGSDFGTHVDVEYRPTLNRLSRYADQRVNELYVSYGMTDFSRTSSELPFGVALGRLSIREAGYAQADGLAFRLRVHEGIHAGVFGGVTGNPYGYNWALRSSQFISTGWLTGGAFGALRTSRLSVNLAGVVTYARADADVAGIDRIYASIDAAYQPFPELTVFVNGRLDVLPSGQTIQNLEAVGSYAPSNELSLSLGLGRFSTVIYDLSNGYSYQVSPYQQDVDRVDGAVGNSFNNTVGLRDKPIVDPDGNPIIPFDAALFATVYNQARLRAGYRLFGSLEVFGTLNALIRDFSSAQVALDGASIVGRLESTSLRLLPAAGARFRDPDWLDARVQAAPT